LTTSMALDDPTWPTDVQNLIAAFAKSGIEFSADDLRKSIRPAPHDNLWGAAFSAARRRGIITCAGYRESTTPSRRHGVVRLWAAPPKETHHG
jgi:hypothetical protein